MGEDHRELVERWVEASRAGDTAAVLALMTDDALFMVPGREPFGKEEFRQTSEMMRDVRVDGSAEVREIEVLGDHAWNHIDITITQPDGESLRQSGLTLTIVRKSDDGRWRLYRDANLVS